MPKFYVESGNLQLVTSANDPRAAAIWAVHRTLSTSLPFLCETERTDVRPAVAPQPQLGEMIHVNERGFGRAGSQVFETLGVVSEWTQLLLAVDRLQKGLAAI